MRYFVRLAYNGKNYCGWQVQGDTPTVQLVLNKALSVILKDDIQTTGAGRTDTGVHAEEFFAHFDYSGNRQQATGISILKEHGAQSTEHSLVYKLNGFLPPDIAVYDILPVREDAHARFSAISRTYKYYIHTKKSPFYNELAYYLYGKLDIQKMNEAAALLKDYKDFTSFSKLHTDTKTNNCKIQIAEWSTVHGRQSTALTMNSELQTPNSELLVFTIKADRFLRNMVRAIVGTLLDVGRGKLSIDDFRKIIESQNRSDAGFSVPAHALFLTGLEYPENIFIKE